MNDHFHKLMVLVCDVEDVGEIPFRLDRFQKEKIPIESATTLSIRFVCRVPSKWYLKRRETDETSAWKGYNPLCSLRESTCSAPMSSPLQAISDDFRDPTLLTYFVASKGS